MSELPTDMDLLLEAIEQMMGEKFARHMSDRVYVAFELGRNWSAVERRLEAR